jgi:hypothetical protein
MPDARPIIRRGELGRAGPLDTGYSGITDESFLFSAFLMNLLEHDCGDSVF